MTTTQFLTPVLCLTGLTLSLILHHTRIDRHPLIALLLLNPLAAITVGLIAAAPLATTIADLLAHIAAVIVCLAALMEKTGMLLDSNLLKESRR